MRRPSVLDVTRAIKEVAPSYPEIASWWYVPHVTPAPSSDLREPRGEFQLEVVVRPAPDSATDSDRIGRDLTAKLWSTPVTVRLHQGEGEPQRLFRILSAAPSS